MVNKTDNIIVTIDGPAASGKSTIARKLAKKLAFIHLNSGILYRAVALGASEAGIDLDDESAVADFAKNITFEFSLLPDGSTALFVDSNPVHEKLASLEAGRLAGKVALLPSVRDALLVVQRDAATKHSLVVDGRDSGTIVFPEAQLKFYLDASVTVRAKRRLKELVERSSENPPTIEQVEHDVQARDEQDMQRPVAPLKVADDAIVVDSSDLTIDEVINKMFQSVSETMP